jgi:hypothetical protein
MEYPYNVVMWASTDERHNLDRYNTIWDYDKNEADYRTRILYKSIATAAEACNLPTTDHMIIMGLEENA